MKSRGADLLLMLSDDWCKINWWWDAKIRPVKIYRLLTEPNIQRYERRWSLRTWMLTAGALVNLASRHRRNWCCQSRGMSSSEILLYNRKIVYLQKQGQALSVEAFGVCNYAANCYIIFNTTQFRLHIYTCRKRVVGRQFRHLHWRLRILWYWTPFLLLSYEVPKDSQSPVQMSELSAYNPLPHLRVTSLTLAMFAIKFDIYWFLTQSTAYEDFILSYLHPKALSMCRMQMCC